MNRLGLTFEGIRFTPPICEECRGWPTHVTNKGDGLYYAACPDCGWGLWYTPEVAE